MTRRRTTVLVLLLAIVSAAQAAARPPLPSDPLFLRAAPTTLRPDKAYLLMRSSHAKSGLFGIEHVLLRVPAQAEVAAFDSARQIAYDRALPDLQKKSRGEPVNPVNQFPFQYDGTTNVFATRSGDWLADGEMRTFLIEVPAGTYILYGIAFGSKALATCNCLGTVSFDARPGVVTDMGSLYADKVHGPSPVPHLEDNVGKSMFGYGFIFGEALVPTSTADSTPIALKAFPLAKAEYHAVGLFHEAGASSINRLAPIDGVLGYKHGQVIDLRTGKGALSSLSH